MDRATFNQLRDNLYQKIIETNQTKGNDYSGNEDALNNFKEAAKRFDLSPVQIWAVYAFKHIDAIATYVKDGAVKSEPIEDRIMDAILYLFLLHGLIKEREESELEDEDIYIDCEKYTGPKIDSSNLPVKGTVYYDVAREVYYVESSDEWIEVSEESLDIAKNVASNRLFTKRDHKGKTILARPGIPINCGCSPRFIYHKARSCDYYKEQKDKNPNGVTYE